MKRILVASMLGCSIIAAASPAFAGQGYLVANVTLRAGPDVAYPSVVGLRAGTPVGIEGCVDGWSWCDVTTGNDRGWVSANYLQEEYQGQRVLVPQYGVQIGIPIVTFVFGNYWDNYYSGRSWYHNRDHWSHVQPHYATYGHSHGGSYGGSYGGSHANSYGGGTHYVTPDQARTSAYQTNGYHTNGTRQTTVVTTQPGYQSGRTHATYQNGYSTSASQGRQTGSVTRSQSIEGRQTGSVTHSQSVEGRHTGSVTHTGSKPAKGHDAQGYANHSSGEENAGNAHHGNGSAQRNNGQTKTVAEHKQHKDKPEKDNGGGKDKNQN